MIGPRRKPDRDLKITILINLRRETAGTEALLNRSDRRRYSLATHELERRWKAVRERMAVRGIDFLVDEVRMVKSEEELRLHRESAYLHEMGYAVAKGAIRPGRAAGEAIEEIRYAQVLAGSEVQQISITFLLIFFCPRNDRFLVSKTRSTPFPPSLGAYPSSVSERRGGGCGHRRRGGFQGF